jgi:hypothetical protein
MNKLVINKNDICINGGHAFEFDYEDEDDLIKIEALVCNKCGKKSIGWNKK